MLTRTQRFFDKIFDIREQVKRKMYNFLIKQAMMVS